MELVLMQGLWRFSPVGMKTGYGVMSPVTPKELLNAVFFIMAKT